MRFRAGLACSVAVGALLAGAGASMAADFTVESGQTETATQELTDPGDRGLIEAGGAIDTSGENAVDSLNDYQTVANDGLITTSGGFVYGINSTGLNARIDNAGDIATSGEQADGINSTGDDARIDNSGSITTTGVHAFGIYSTGDDARIDNGGSITTTGDSVSDGIHSSGDNARIDNSGSITTSGDGAWGIASSGLNARIDNSGDITTSGYGINSGGANAWIGNSGAITTSGEHAYGVVSRNADAWIDNSGDITTLEADAWAIWSDGANARIDNSGDITTEGDNARGIASQGPDARINNSGDIETMGMDADGIYSEGANARINNSGDIRTSWDRAYGISSLGPDARIDNGGGITTSARHAYGIYSEGANARINNSGDITTSGTDADGIYSFGPDAWINNSGDITASGSSARGIFSNGPDARIHNSGDITTLEDGANGISSTGLDAQIDNSGGIATSGQFAYGIGSNGTDARIDNSGTITTLGFHAHGIYSNSTGVDARISNSGNITTSGEGGWGILSQGANARIDNSGDIATSGLDAYGIYSNSTGTDARIDNSGEIATSGNNAVGIIAGGADTQINNNGGITTSGSGASSIASHGSNARIDNSGYIKTSGVGAYGIRLFGSGTTVTNSGTIVSEQSLAIEFTQTDATLNLLAGSVIQGEIDFLQSATATLNIGPGLNTALTFTGLPGVIDSKGAPMVVQGSLVAVVDPTGFSAQDEMLTDLTRAIAGSVDARLNAARFGYAPATGPVMAYAEADGPDATQTGGQFGFATGRAGSQGGPGFWAAGIGAYRNQDADGVDVGFDTSLGGLLVGYDAEVSGGTRIGGFLGASISRFETDANSQEIDADSYFGGVYGSYTGERYFLDFAVTGGVSQQSSDRSVANNLVIGGIEHARADYDGVFVSPSATIGTTYAIANGGTLIPSFRARYAGLFLDGYEERGSTANLSVDDRDVNVFDFRAQFAYALAARPAGDGSFHTAFRLGADAIFADNDDVATALLGQALNFSVSGDDTLRGFAGFDALYRTEGGSSFFLGAEAGYDSGDAFTFDIRGGLQIPL